MGKALTPTRTRPPAEAAGPGRSRRQSASTADGLIAQRAAFAERERRTAQAMTAARRLSPQPRP
jgi:hypothetical protein